MDTAWTALSDELGPEKVVFLRNPDADLEAVVVVDNTAAGPSIGGVRLAEDIGVMEVGRLARAMTYKNAAAGLAHGGGKAGIVGDPAMGKPQRERLVRAFGAAIKDLVDYIPGPDMGIDETCMAAIHDEIGRVVGLPAVKGGIPLDRLGATAFGLAIAAEAADDRGIIRLHGARVVIQGFGAVGTHVARFLTDRGAIVVAISDSKGAIADPDGLDVDKLITWKIGGNPVGEFPTGIPATHHALISMDCEIWLPAARPDVITVDNCDAVRASLILPGANIAVTQAAESLLHQRGVVSLPDFIVNAGGVICGAAEYRGSTANQAFAMIEERIRVNTHEILDRAATAEVTPMAAAQAMAKERVVELMGYRRRF